MSSNPTPTRGDWGCTGCACAILVFAVLAVWVLQAANVHGPAYAASCISNIKQPTNGLLIYAQDYDGRLPPADKWHDAGFDYVKTESVYVCPTRQKLGTGYAFNQALGGRLTKKAVDAEKVPLLFESRLGQRNGTDMLQSFVVPHNERGSISFLDGHVRRLARAPSATDGLRREAP